jgi:hypothetical protein
MGVLGMRSAVVFHGIKDSSRKEEGKRVIAVVVVLQQKLVTAKREKANMCHR